jgi:hypothetical protein
VESPVQSPLRECAHERLRRHKSRTASSDRIGSRWRGYIGAGSGPAPPPAPAAAPAAAPAGASAAAAGAGGTAIPNCAATNSACRWCGSPLLMSERYRPLRKRWAAMRGVYGATQPTDELRGTCGSIMPRARRSARMTAARRDILVLRVTDVANSAFPVQKPKTQNFSKITPRTKREKR